MPNAKHRYYRGMIDAPSVFIAGAAVALWALWPALHHGPLQRDLPAPRVFSTHISADGDDLVSRPDLFALPSPMGFAGLGLMGGMPDIPRTPQGEPLGHLLTRDGPTTPEHTTTPDPSRILRIAETSLSGYRHRPATEPVFVRPEHSPRKLTTRCSRFLEEGGFSIPFPDKETLAGFDRAWTVDLFVDIGDNGIVEHVFIENGCDDPKTNDMVVRWVSGGRLAQPGTKLSGRVSVNFGAR